MFRIRVILTRKYGHPKSKKTYRKPLWSQTVSYSVFRPLFFVCWKQSGSSWVHYEQKCWNVGDTQKKVSTSFLLWIRSPQTPPECPSGWPDWANFRAQCMIVYSGSFFIISEVAHIFGLLFLKLRLCINFDKNVGGCGLGSIFHKLIWSPCCPQRWSVQAEETFVRKIFHFENATIFKIFSPKNWAKNWCLWRKILLIYAKIRS
jgi:hypothetical protein